MSATGPQQTETLHDDARQLDLRSDAEILSRLLRSQQQALGAITTALPFIAQASALMVKALRDGGRIIYGAAGSSALMGLADGSEIPGTFGLPADRILICMAGGIPLGSDMPGFTEDDTAAALRDAANVTPQDVVIALSASGSTPYSVAFARAARERGAGTICIANNPDAPLFGFADVAILLDTPPEIVAGSTRLGAATAQKAALNMMSTLMGIRLGHVFDGMMVNLVADNAKLQSRAAGMVEHITGVPHATAQDSLERAKGHVKQAVLLASGAASLDQANHILEQANGELRAALRQL